MAKTFPGREKDIVELATRVQASIEDGFRANEYDERPAIQLTVGSDGEDWDFQTGDTSLVGGAYGYPVWGTATLYRDSDPAEAAKEIIKEINDGLAEKDHLKSK